MSARVMPVPPPLSAPYDDRVRIVADDQLAGPHQAVVGHHLVRDARLGIVEAA